MERYSRSFLKERWEEKRRDELAEISPEQAQREKDLDIYLDLRKKTAEDPGLSAALVNIEKAAVRYRATVNAFSKERMGDSEKDPAALKESDDYRRLAHEVMIGEINVLSRLFRKTGLDNEWRRDIGLEREDAGRWALNVAGLIYKRFEENTYDAGRVAK